MTAGSSRETAIVTGAFGFVGRHVAAALARTGVRVIGIGHGSWGRDEWRQWGIADWHAVDVTLESLVTYGREPDLVIHCAGSGSVAFSLAYPAQDFHRTVGSTLSVLEYLRVHRPQARLVIPSSAGVYGAATRMPIKISDQLRPFSPYGLHKKMAEDLCRSYASQFGIRVASVRLFSVFGIGIRKQLLWDACMKLDRGDATFAGTGLETRDWLHVADAAELLVTAAGHSSDECPAANGGTGEAVTVRDVVELVAACLEGGIHPQFSGQVRAGDPVNYQADIRQALEWGWTPQRHWRQEVPAYVAWFRSGAP